MVITPFSSWLEGQQARIFAKGTNNPRAFLKSMQVYEAMMRITKEDNALARQMAEELIALYPEYYRVYQMLAWAYLFEV